MALFHATWQADSKISFEKQNIWRTKDALRRLTVVAQWLCGDGNAQWLALRHRWQTPPAKPSSPGTSIQSDNWLNWHCRKWEREGPIEGWPVLQILTHTGKTKYFYPIPDIDINLDSSKFVLNAKFCIQVTTHIVNFIIQGVGGNTFTKI